MPRAPRVPRRFSHCFSFSRRIFFSVFRSIDPKVEGRHRSFIGTWTPFPSVATTRGNRGYHTTLTEPRDTSLSTDHHREPSRHSRVNGEIVVKTRGARRGTLLHFISPALPLSFVDPPSKLYLVIRI